MFCIKNILVGNTISKECERTLSLLGYNVIKLPEYSRLQTYVSTHADMLIFCDGKSIVTSREYYNENRGLFDLLDVQIVLSDESIGKEYPNDILFNAVLTKYGVLFSKNDYTSKFIKSMAKYEVNVNQGYTACSTCKVNDKAFITTDSGLYNAYISNGIDCILVSKDDIYLPGYDCGFIGGASVVLDDKVCFFGDVKKHRDYEKILEFARKYDKDVISLSDEKMTDIGGAVVV